MLRDAVLDGLFDAGRHFVGLAVAPADLALAVADDDQGGEAEAAAALDHRGAALDLDDLVDQFASVRFAATSCSSTEIAVIVPAELPSTSCGMCRIGVAAMTLKIQAGLAGRVGQAPPRGRDTGTRRGRRPLA